MLLTNKQKQLILNVLRKEKRNLFSKNKGELLNTTIADLEQSLRNESINANNLRK
jgi:hypothetical protein